MYAATRKSVQRFVTDMIGMLGGTLSYVDFDAHGELDKLPNNDCIGVHAFGFTDDTEFFDVVFGITLSTYDDPNLLRMTAIMDSFYARLRPLALLPVYDPESAAVIGAMTIFKGTTIHPIDRAERRAAVSIQASARVILETPGYATQLPSYLPPSQPPQGSSGTPSPKQFTFVVTTPGAQSVVINPTPNTPGNLAINGLIQLSSEYAVSGASLMLGAELLLQPGDVITYDYF